ALARVSVVIVSRRGGAGLLSGMRGAADAASAAARLGPSLVPYALIGAGAIAVVLVGRHLDPKLRTRLLGVFVAVDLVTFTLLAVVAALPNLGHGANAAPGRRHTAAKVVLAGKPADSAAPRKSATRPIAELGYRGRFAIYDPDLLDANELPLLGPPDLNVLRAMPSVQGYSSLVDSRYATATGSHQATGEGQNVLAPRAIDDGVLDQLDTS